MDFDLGMFLYGFVAAMVGAALSEVGQAVQHFRNTWRCPKCEAPLKFTVSSEDKAAREQVAEHHIRTVHSQ
jgi:hypothetical protein